MSVLMLMCSVAFRNLKLYRLRTFMISGLIGFGSWLAITGASLLRDIQESMRRSITESVAGDLQVYSGKAKDDLALFGGGFMGRADIGSLSEFAEVEKVALANPNVSAFVPLGVDMAIISRGNELDDLLAALREALRSGDEVLIGERRELVKFQLDQIKNELELRLKVTTEKAEVMAQLGDVAKASFPEFLKNLDEAALQFLDAKIAPLSGEKAPIYLAYFATDVVSYRRNFPKFKVLEGEDLPPGKRGLMIGRKVREDQLKNKVARLFDRIHKRVVVMGLTMEGDDDSRRDAQDLVLQYDQIMSNLSRKEAEQLALELTDFGIAQDPTKEDLIPRVTGQVKAFLAVNDSNFKDRFTWFYEKIAPKIKLYELSPGDTVVLRSYTKSGYVKAIPVKVFGVFGFEGLENTDLAGGLSLLDLVSFRELYGQMTQASQDELKSMRQEIQVKDVTRSEAEEALFGNEAPTVVETKPSAPLPVAATTGASTTSDSTSAPLKVAPVLAATFPQEEVTKGLALSGAIRVKDIRSLDTTITELKEQFKAAGLDIKVVDWQKAAGMIGQFVNVVRGVLVFATLVIFLVALVIINNSIVVSIFGRFKEIGTMRAIGAQKNFVLGMILTESGLSGMIGAFSGSAIATMMLFWFNMRGIPAGNDFLTFLFAGPRLFPKLHWDIILCAPLAVGGIATVASIYAARFAANIAPIEAMQERE